MELGIAGAFPGRGVEGEGKSACEFAYAARVVSVAFGIVPRGKSLTLRV
jgi:hypothetical protein